MQKQCWAAVGLWAVTKGRHKAMTSASPKRPFSSGSLKTDGNQSSHSGRDVAAFTAWPVWCCYICALEKNQVPLFFSDWKKMMPTLPWSVCGVCKCAFSVCFFLSCCAINSGECYCLSYFMCHWLPQSLMKNVHCICKQSLFMAAFLLVSTFSLSSPPSKDLSSAHPAML